MLDQDLFDFDIMDEIIGIVESKSRNYDGIFSLKKGETKVIQFLMEGRAGITFIRHGRFDKENPKSGFNIPCPVSFEKFKSNRNKKWYEKTNCPYCDEYQNDPKTKHEIMTAWLIWNRTDGCKQAFVYKPDSEKGPCIALAYQYKDKGTITDRQFKIRKGKEENFPATVLDKDDPWPNGKFVPTAEEIAKGCVIPKNDYAAQEELIKLIASAWCPGIITPGPEFVLPPYHKLQKKVEPQEQFADMFGSTDGDELLDLDSEE